ncbi:hypothetical protein JB92DRAFT_2979478 [Gautieria morchelliformis]|nr:hypothetical protein JB92DRAFT_2979478 [Gautieria morchelliformis]
MVSADNVNYDVLSFIFAFLRSNDLVSAALVSKSFKAGATPRLYRSVHFRLDQMKRWPRAASPFSTILSHPRLGVHVRYCDIRAVPKLKGQPHPAFISSCAASLALCPNLLSFTCTSDVPAFLSLFPDKTRLVELKIHAALELEQSAALTQVEGLQSLALYSASLNICHVLPAWVPTLANTLTSLTITNSREFNEVVFKSLVLSLPRLRRLHVVGCHKISHQSVFRLISHTPLLESLSFTTWENPSTSLEGPMLSLPHLHHLSIDTRCSFSPSSVPPLYNSIFRALFACPLSSLTFKLSERMIVGDGFISQIVNDYGATLTRFNAVNVSLSDDNLELVCTGCHQLEQLSVVVPDMEFFPDILSSCESLRTLIDVGGTHSVHKPRNTLTADDVRDLFQCVPGLRTIISGNRRWTCERIPFRATRPDSEEDDSGEEPVDYLMELKLERLKHANNAAQHLMEPPS